MPRRQPDPDPSSARTQTPTTAPLQLIGVDEVASRLALSSWAVRDLLLRGHLPCVRLPGKAGKDLRRVLVSLADLESFVSDHREQRVHIPTPTKRHSKRRRRVRQ